ncbi:MAG: LuxR family regulatory protein [Gemmataceae bacterium]|nr:LuxR family regulatory protein [Gemmataceae bacterium]
MPKSAHVSSPAVRAIHNLVGECRDLGDNPTRWREHAFARLAVEVGADLVVGGELAGLKSGCPRDLGNTSWGWDRGFDRRGWDRALELLQREPNYSSIAGEYGRRMSPNGGDALSLTELVTEPTWKRSVEYTEVFRTIGVEHAVYCLPSVPGKANEASGSILLRAPGRPDFSAREKAIVREAHALLVALVGGPLARFSDPSPADLSPRVRDVLRCLLEGDGDKQVAARLGISRYTVNVHAKAIYRHFGVRSRAELLARWVRRGWSSGRPGW